MRFLITRPSQDAAAFAERLRKAGHESVTASLLSVQFHSGPALDLENVQAIVVTSANGVRALARRSERRDLPVYAVGPQTAHAARLAGFARIESADGDAAALAAALPCWARPEDGLLLHAAGKEGSGRLAALLEARGFRVRSEVLYDVVSAAELPPAAIAALASEALDAAFFFSPRSAAAFRDCVVAAMLAPALARLAAMCISQATADALAPLVFGRVVVAAAPNQDALLASLAIIAQG